MTDLKNGKIYKIVSNNTDLIYIGSTSKKKLSTRMSEHRAQYKRHKNGLCKGCNARLVFEYEDCEIILIEDVNYTCKDELRRRERYWIDTLECVNKCKPGGQLKDELIKKRREFYNNNKERLLLASSEYYKNMDEDKKKAYYKKEQMNKITCDCCGFEMLKRDMYRHVKTKKHLQNYKKHLLNF